MDDNDNLKASIDELRGIFDAFQYMLKVLIVTHPDRAKLRRWWRSDRTQHIDVVSDSADYQSNASFRDAHQRTIAVFNDFIEPTMPGEDD